MSTTRSPILSHPSSNDGASVLKTSAGGGGPNERESISIGEIRAGVLNPVALRSGRKAIVVRRGAEIHAFGEVCPHMGADLSEATYCEREGTLQCRWHGYVFSADDGQFLRNPNEGFMQALRKPSAHFTPGKTPRYRLAIIPTSQKDGLLFFGSDKSVERTPEADREA